MSSRLAILVRCGRTPRHVLPTLRSVQHQTDRASSIWLLTDSSTPGAGRDWLAALARHDGCRHVHVNGRTPGADRNAAVRACTEDLILFVDAGDVLEPSFNTRTIDALVRQPEAPFVTTGVVIAGPDRSRSIVSPSADLQTILADTRVIRGGAVFRREAWSSVEGFDESLDVLDDYDFWLRCARIAPGTVVPQPLLIRHLRREPPFPSECDAALRATTLAAIVARHAAHAPGAEPADLLMAAEARLRQLGAEYHAALDRRDRSVAEIGTLVADAQAVWATVPNTVDLGDLRRVTPVSRDWGYERGGPVDRHYIEEFLTQHAADVRGAVLEVQEPDYTQRFGGDRVTQSDVVDLDAGNPRATIVSDLRAAANIAPDTYDCVILTQTIHVIDDMASVVAECHRILKPGGVVLATLPSASRVCVEYGQDGDFWRVTEAGARRLFGHSFGHGQLEVESRGNVLVNTAFLSGLGGGELTADEYAFADPYYPALVTVRAIKSAANDSRASWSGSAHVQRSRAGGPTPIAGVLLYHRVAFPDSDIHRLAVAPDEFRRQMQCLRDHYRPVPLQSLVEGLRAGNLESGAVAITFDDGYADNLEVASPILEELGLPATFFITTEGLDDDSPYEFWWDRLERLLLGKGGCPPRLTVLLNGEVRDLATGTFEERLAAHWIVYEAIVGAAAGVRDAVLDDIARWRPDSRINAAGRRMSRAEIQALAARPSLSIGAHTVRHLMLPKQPGKVIEQELTQNRQALQQLTGQTVADFAYPFGAFDEKSAAAVREAGFTAAVACGDSAVPENVDLMAVPRLDPLARGDVTFSAWIDSRVGRPAASRRPTVTSTPNSSAAPAASAPRRPRALVAGWFSYSNSDYTAGDLLACDLVSEWLRDAGIESDVATVAPLAGGVSLDLADPAAYTHAVFVCGPFVPSKLEAEFIAKFRGCTTIGVNLSLPVPLTEWNPFAQLFERNSSRAAHADIVFAAHEPAVPVIGVCLVEPFGGADTRTANAAIERLLAARPAAVVPIDTRLDTNTTGLRSKAEVEAVLARMDAVVTTRLHGTVLALKNGVPVVVIDPEPGGSRVLKQAQAIGWPMAFAVDAADDDTLRRALDYCLTPEARAKAAECKARADADVAGIRARFIASLTSPS